MVVRLMNDQWHGEDLHCGPRLSGTDEGQAMECDWTAESLSNNPRTTAQVEEIVRERTKNCRSLRKIFGLLSSNCLSYALRTDYTECL
jgi:hypothetical protein